MVISEAYGHRNQVIISPIPEYQQLSLISEETQQLKIRNSKLQRQDLTLWAFREVLSVILIALRIAASSQKWDITLLVVYFLHFEMLQPMLVVPSLKIAYLMAKVEHNFDGC